MMQRLIFLLIFTLLLIKPSANAIFLSTLGVENLPLAFVCVAVVALFVTSIYNRFIESYSTTDLFIRSNVVSIIILVLLGIFLLISWSKVVVAFLLYLFFSIFGILSASQFWILANQLFNAREARKYFGFIGAGAIAGGISGGYVASLISAFTQSEFLVFIAAFVLIIAIDLIRKIKIEAPIDNNANRPVSKKEQNLLRPFFLVRKSRHLTNLALILAISVLVAKLIDYQFGYFSTLIITDEEELTSFYGFWFSTFNLISLFIQLFITTKIVGRFGVGHSLLLLPLMLMLSTVVILILPVLAIAILLKLTDACMKQSINKAATELMMLPIPQDIKVRTKTFLDVFVDSLATGLSGLLLLFVIQALNLPNFVVSAMILVSVFVWLILANNLRKEYKSVFRRSLQIASEQKEFDVQNLFEDYQQILKSGTNFQILKALSFLKENPISDIDKEIRNLLQNEDASIVQTAVDTLMYMNSDYSEEIKPLLYHANQNVKIAAFEYLINHQDKLDPNYLIQLLNDDNLEIKIAAIAAYSKEFQNSIPTLNALRIQDRINQILEAVDSSEEDKTYLVTGVLKAIALGRFSNFFPVIDTFLTHSNPVLKSQAILAAGETRSPYFLGKLLKFLDSTDPPKSIFMALAKYGSKVMFEEFEKLEKTGRKKALRNLPSVLEKIPDQQSIIILQEMAESDDLVARNNAIRSLGELREKYPLLKIDEKVINRLLLQETKYSNYVLNILSNKGKGKESKKDNPDYEKLIELLRKKVDDNLKVIFELLHIIYPPEKYLEIYDYVKNPDDTLRNNAIEYLENVLEPDLKATVISLIEYNLRQTLDIDPVRKIEFSPESIKDFLLHIRDDELRAVAQKYYRS